MLLHDLIGFDVLGLVACMRILPAYDLDLSNISHVTQAISVVTSCQIALLHYGEPTSKSDPTDSPPASSRQSGEVGLPILAFFVPPGNDKASFPQHSKDGKQAQRQRHDRDLSWSADAPHRLRRLQIGTRGLRALVYGSFQGWLQAL